jgi:hypothetical protein
MKFLYTVYLRKKGLVREETAVLKSQLETWRLGIKFGTSMVQKHRLLQSKHWQENPYHLKKSKEFSTNKEKQTFYLEIQLISYVTPCRPVNSCRRFVGAYCHHPQSSNPKGGLHLLTLPWLSAIIEAGTE